MYILNPSQHSTSLMASSMLRSLCSASAPDNIGPEWAESPNRQLDTPEGL